MKLYLRYYPQALKSNLQFSNVEPYLEVPEFNGNLSMLYAMLSEIFLFCTCEKVERDIYLTNDTYKVKIPFDPVTYWTNEFPKLDLKKFDWFYYYEKFSDKETLVVQRIELIKFLLDSGIVFGGVTASDVTSVQFSPYPHLEAMKMIQMRIGSLLDESDHVLFQIKEHDGEKVMDSKLPTYYMEQGLTRVGYHVYKIKYTFGGEIIINDRYQLSKLNYDSANDRFFEYVVQFPKSKINRESLVESIGELDRPISKLVYDCGFSGELKKLFFPKVSNNSVYFNNPVTQDDLLAIGIDKDALLKQLRELKTVQNSTE